jgi:hypothetical protein
MINELQLCLKKKSEEQVEVEEQAQVQKAEVTIEVRKF